MSKLMHYRLTVRIQVLLMIITLIVTAGLANNAFAESDDDEEDQSDDESGFLDLSVSFERTATRFIDEEPGNKTTEQENEFEVGIEHGLVLSENLSAFYSLSALGNKQRESETVNFISRNTMELNEAWLRWQPAMVDDLSLTIGRMDLEDEQLWWWDETFDAFTVNHDGMIGSSVSLGAMAREISTDAPDRPPEERNVFWVLAESSLVTESFGHFGLVLTHKEDRSPAYMPGLDIDELQLDEVDDSLTWLGVRFSRSWNTDVFGSIGGNLDAGWVTGTQRTFFIAEEEEDDDDEEDTQIIGVKERVTIAGSEKQRINGWGWDARLHWAPFEDTGPSLSLGYAMGSGNTSNATNRSRRFIQTRLQSTDDTEQSYGWLSEPALGNLTVLSLRASMPVVAGHVMHLQHHQYRRTSLGDDYFESEIDLDTVPRTRDLGSEWGFRWSSEFESGLAVSATVSRFRAGDAFGEFKGETTDKVEIGVGFEF